MACVVRAHVRRCARRVCLYVCSRVRARANIARGGHDTRLIHSLASRVYLGEDTHSLGFFVSPLAPFISALLGVTFPRIRLGVALRCLVLGWKGAYVLALRRGATTQVLEQIYPKF